SFPLIIYRFSIFILIVICLFWSLVHYGFQIIGSFNFLIYNSSTLLHLTRSFIYAGFYHLYRMTIGSGINLSCHYTFQIYINIFFFLFYFLSFFFLFFFFFFFFLHIITSIYI